MRDCPICLSSIETDQAECACGYSSAEEEIVDENKIRDYLGRIESWSEAVKFKRRINEVQLAKRGPSIPIPGGGGGWSIRETAKLLDESVGTTSQDIKVADAFEEYPELLECRNKTAARKELKRIERSADLDSIRKGFKLESELQGFLEQDWDETELAKSWRLDTHGRVNTGEIGEMDLLARHKQKPIWLVVELKVSRSSDQAVGQILRYMGWVDHRLAEENESVRGLIITGAVRKELIFALHSIAKVNDLDIDLMRYDLKEDEFALESVSPAVEVRRELIEELNPQESKQLLENLERQRTSV